MRDLEWEKSDTPKATHEDLDKIEAELGVTIPEILRTILTTYGAYAPTRNGEIAKVVRCPNPETGELEFAGYFANFRKPVTDCPTLDWLEEDFNFRPKKAIEFGTDGASNMYLVYDNDPTNSNPEIRNVYSQEDTLEDAWTLFSPDVESFFNNLITVSEAKALQLHPYGDED